MEWFRGKPLPISTRHKFILAALVVFLAQAVAYDRLSGRYEALSADKENISNERDSLRQGLIDQRTRDERLRDERNVKIAALEEELRARPLPQRPVPTPYPVRLSVTYNHVNKRFNIYNHGKEEMSFLGYELDELKPVSDSSPQISIPGLLQYIDATEWHNALERTLQPNSIRRTYILIHLQDPRGERLVLKCTLNVLKQGAGHIGVEVQNRGITVQPKAKRPPEGR